MSARVKSVLGGAAHATPKFILNATVLNDWQTLSDLGVRNGGELELKVVLQRLIIQNDDLRYNEADI